MASVASVAAAVLLCLVAYATAEAVPPPEPPPPAKTRLVYATSEIVPIPASIPHEEGDMVDRRILPDLRWISLRYPIYITDGYSGPLLGGEHVGCNNCHVAGSDHYNGLAVDIVPIENGGKCDASWAPITSLALWAEPRQNLPVAPFRWVGYNGDAGHGCGNHLHLSWNHAPAPRYELAEWVEVFPVSFSTVGRHPRGKPAPKPPKGHKGPAGGLSTDPSGGLAPNGKGD
jgi:hypothetical protein